MQFEIDIIVWLQNNRSSLLDALFQFFTLFGEETVLILILGFIYWCYDKAHGEVIGLTVFISIAINSVLKIIINRPRPFLVDSRIENLKPSTSGSSSMPSGHTQTAATTYFSLNRLFKKNWMLIIAIVITFFVAFSRMYLGVHYLSDVLVGAALGIILAIYIPKLLDKIENKRRFYNIALIAVNGALLIILVISYIGNMTDAGVDAFNLFDTNENIFKMFGTMSGFLIAINFEKNHVNFENHKHIWKNIIRFVLGLAIIMAIRYLLSFIFDLIVDTDSLIVGQGFKGILGLLLDYIRYATMLFIGIGVYPILFKKMNI